MTTESADQNRYDDIIFRNWTPYPGRRRRVLVCTLFWLLIHFVT